MAIIIDNNKYENPEMLIMSDDGMGSNVRIPSFLISHQDGQKLKKVIHNIEVDETKHDKFGEESQVDKEISELENQKQNPKSGKNQVII